MDEVQRKRALAVISRIERALEPGVQHFDHSGQRLTEVSAIIEAWAHGGVTVKEPENHQVIDSWIRQ